jgi:hypothetical protein
MIPNPAPNDRAKPTFNHPGSPAPSTASRSRSVRTSVDCPGEASSGLPPTSVCDMTTVSADSGGEASTVSVEDEGAAAVALGASGSPVSSTRADAGTSPSVCDWVSPVLGAVTASPVCGISSADSLRPSFSGWTHLSSAAAMDRSGST